jgi:dihydroorotase
MTTAPAEILGLEAGTLSEHAAADVCVFDANVQWVLTEDSLLSRGKNSPFLGQTMRGRVCYTLLGGAIVHEAA